LLIIVPPHIKSVLSSTSMAYHDDSKIVKLS
jgi:hypothetical protein